MKIDKKRVFASIVAWMCCCTVFANGVDDFVCRQLTAYPLSRLLDLYKSLFQDYMGAEHLISDEQTVKAYLDKELESVALDELLPWYYEPCGLNGNYVRVSLRVVKEGLISPEALLGAFIRSANDAHRPTLEQWTLKWHSIVAEIDQMDLRLPEYEQDRKMIEQVLSSGQYAISHSPDYRNAYHPHYRIVRRDIFDREIRPFLKETQNGE